MSVGSARRYYLGRRLTAKAQQNSILESLWQSKQEAEPGTALASDFPYRSRLVAIGYGTAEDIAGATTTELQQVGFTEREAAAVIAAL